MTDTKLIAGSRDDLVVDASRCLKMRFNESSCRRCVDICPHGAVTLDGRLSINPEHCRGCMLCTSVCPVGALEYNKDILACLSQLSRVPEPVLGCILTKENSNANLACLGGLSEEHLLTLSHTLSGSLTLNMVVCHGCPNNFATQHLRQRLEVLLDSDLLAGGCIFNLAASENAIRFRNESVDRRSFFKSFRNSLFQSTAIILSSNKEPTERRTEYSAKRVPIRRELLNCSRKKLSSELEVRVSKHFDSYVSFSEACTMCQGCVATCPTGALQTELSDLSPLFYKSLCTGCGLCAEFCMENALFISRKFR